MDVTVFARYEFAWQAWGYACGLGFLIGAAALVVRAIFREGGK